MRKLASIQRIKSINPIDGSDRLEVVNVLGWYCVAGKGDFKVGDLCAYFEVDSFLPLSPEFEFLRKSCYRKLEDGTEGLRIRTVSLRGQTSQGLVMPLSKFKFSFKKFLEEGDDVTSFLGVTKYESPIPAELVGEVIGPFPGFIPKTDETRIQGHPNVLERHKGKTFIAREKLDGTSCTIYHKNGEFGVCGRTLNLIEKEGNTYWKMANRYELKDSLPGLGNISLQGEIIGEGIQGNKYKLKGQDIYFFNAFDIDKQVYFNDTQLSEICGQLKLKIVPFVKELILNNTVEEIVEMSNFKSSINPNTQAEGLVFRPIEEERDMKLGRLSFKAISKEFLLKYED